MIIILCVFFSNATKSGSYIFIDRKKNKRERDMFRNTRMNVSLYIFYMALLSSLAYHEIKIYTFFSQLNDPLFLKKFFDYSKSHFILCL